MDDEQESGAGTKFSLVELILWLIFAIITDLLSLIPYIGLVVSWPFAAFFLFYKWIKGLNFKKTIWASAGDFLAEGIFSTLPANTADVLITYFINKASEIAAEKAGAVMAVGGKVAVVGGKVAKYGGKMAEKGIEAGDMTKIRRGEKIQATGKEFETLGKGIQEAAGGGQKKTGEQPTEGTPTEEAEARPAPPTKTEGEAPFREEAKEAIERGPASAETANRKSQIAGQPTPTATTTKTPTTSFTPQPVSGLKPPLPFDRSQDKPLPQVQSKPFQKPEPKKSSGENEVEAEGNTLDLAA